MLEFFVCAMIGGVAGSFLAHWVLNKYINKKLKGWD